MNAGDIDLSKYTCILRYFDGGRQLIVNPDCDQIVHALNQLENEIDDVTRTVALWRMPEENSEVDRFFMQFQGEKGKLLIGLMKDEKMFATPSFDALLGERGIIDVIGDEWNSDRICTDYSVATAIALSFGVDGKLAFPGIWTVWEGR